MGIIWIHKNDKSKKRTMIGEREEEELGTGMPEFVLIKKEVQQLELTHFLPSFFFFFFLQTNTISSCFLTFIIKLSRL